MIADLTIIVPTLNEKDNVTVLVERLESVLAGRRFEVCFVDDGSTDGTLEVLQSLARAKEHIRYIHRMGRRGLSSACIEGIASSSAPVLAVMDADLQHDETVLPRMLDLLAAGGHDLVVGSRYIEGGSADSFNDRRRLISRAATVLAHKVTRTELSDPMSGFFVLTRAYFHKVRPQLSGVGFKILLDLAASSQGAVSIGEVPYRFRGRHAGDSKLDNMVALEYLALLLDKGLGRFFPLRFLMFVAVGSLGLLVHLGVLGLLLFQTGFGFTVAQGIAAVLTMVLNFSLNNIFTYNDRRLRGQAFALGLFSFVVICSVGAAANLVVGTHLFDKGIAWWLAGLTGALFGSVWNFAVSSQYVWRAKRG
ncbi:MAG: glycosyltransferase [Rhodospirillales bacterium]